MIKFFRNIRKNLLNEGLPAGQAGKTTKYLKYAIGEIALVVIGILIALQINNWNEGKKDKKLEQKILTELMISLQRNCDVMIVDSLRKANWNKSSDIIIQALKNNYKYSDTLTIHFQNARKPGTNLSLSTAGYEGLKNVGFNIITSDILRNNIIELFEVTQKSLFEEMAYFEPFQSDRQSQIDKLFSYDDEKFEYSRPFDVPIIPHNYTNLKKDTIYIAMTKSVKVQRNIIAVHLSKNLKESQRVLQLIKDELKENN